jgi:hypothetical protein
MQRKREPLSRLSPVSGSELDIVGRFRFGRGFFRAVAEHPELQGYNLRPIADPASVLGLVLAGAEPSLDVDLPSLGKQALTVT